MNLISNRIFAPQRILSKTFFHQIIPHKSKASSTFTHVCCAHVKLPEFVEEGVRPVVSMISHLCHRVFDNLFESSSFCNSEELTNRWFGRRFRSRRSIALLNVPFRPPEIRLTCSSCNEWMATNHHSPQTNLRLLLALTGKMKENRRGRKEKVISIFRVLFSQYRNLLPVFTLLDHN
ncbi:hypothetical protein AVEN_253230-1 [Araneus ventricosus]|uniref:Uncharacterized protein n=1 Tax=Araneus ventricosus TaxID=182803 RepID=A0A4Y2RS17_ARAVE|nr:hypothetical protein AVEN_253230-1 [Araneus ventricosus]